MTRGFTKRNYFGVTRGPGRGGGLLNKVLYGEAPPGGLNPYPLINYFFSNIYLERNRTPLLYLKDKPKQ